MSISEYCVYLWLAPVVLQIGIPLVILSSWTIVKVLKNIGNSFSKQETLVAQTING